MNVLAQERPVHARVEASEELRRFAVAEGAVLDGMRSDDVSRGLRKGEGVVAVVEVREGASARQWLVEVGAAEAWPEAATKDSGGVVLHTSTGRRLEFSRSKRALRVRVAGPFEKKAKGMKWREERVEVNGDFLSLGLEEVGPVVRRLAAAKKEGKGSGKLELSFSSEEFPAEQAAVNRASAESLGLGAEAERAMGGSVLALFEFLQAWLTVPALRDGALEVADVSRLSLALRVAAGQTLRLNMTGPFEPESAEAWRLSRERRVESLGFDAILGSRVLARGRLVVTTPRPPLLASAGVVAVTLARPDGKGPVLRVEVLGTRSGEP